MSKSYWVYIMTNKPHGVLYIGVTGQRERRIYEHKNGLIEGFTKKYNLTKLVYIEETHDVVSALQREKNLKHWVRQWKIDLIEKYNPQWHDLAAESDPRVTDCVRPEDDKLLAKATQL
jgi:putative endonuclease